MKLDTIALAIAVVFGGVWLVIALFVSAQFPFYIGLVPILAGVFLLARVVQQRLRNAEDDHYERTVDK